MDIGSKFGLVGCHFLVLGVACCTTLSKSSSWPMVLSQGCVGLACLLLGLVCAHIYSKKPARSHTLRTALCQYLSAEFFTHFGNYLYYIKLPQWGANCGKVQEAVLRNILHHNQNTQYGLDHSFSQIRSREDYITYHPLTTHTDYQQYMNKIIKGEENVLFADKVVHIAFTSGTTGKNKLFPLNTTIKKLKNSTLFMRPMIHRSRYGLGRVVGLRHHPPPRQSDTGMNIAPWSFYAAQPLPFFLTPLAAYQIFKEEVSLYAQGLFALAESQVTLIDGFMATFCYSFFLTLERHWRQMCEDLEKGHIWEGLEMDPVLREELNCHLVADPKRAQEVRKAFDMGIEGIAKRLWPDIKSIHMVASGSFQVYADTLMKCQAKGLRLVSIPHGASEGMVGICMADDVQDMSYVMQPTNSFFEFIRESDILTEEPRTVMMDALEVGQSYEVVLTTQCGLYRYRLGDVIKITGYVQNCPKYEFQYRIGQALNLTWEKMTENTFYKAVSTTLQQWEGMELRDYTAVESICLKGMPEGEGNRYVMFIELTRYGSEVELTEGQIKQFDDHLCKESEIYKLQRDKGSISAMHVIQVQKDGFQKLKYLILSSKPTMQFKMPRVLRNREHIEFLMKFRVCSNKNSEDVVEE